MFKSFGIGNSCSKEPVAPLPVKVSFASIFIFSFSKKSGVAHYNSDFARLCRYYLTESPKLSIVARILPLFLKKKTPMPFSS